MESCVDQDHDFEMLCDAASLIFAKNILNTEKPHVMLIKLEIHVAEEVLRDVNASTLHRADIHIVIVLMAITGMWHCHSTWRHRHKLSERYK